MIHRKDFKGEVLRALLLKWHGGLPRRIGVRPQMDAGARAGHGADVARRARVVVRCARRQFGETRRAGIRGRMKPTHGRGNANRGRGSLHPHSQLSYTGLATFGRLQSKPMINMASNR